MKDILSNIFVAKLKLKLLFLISWLVIFFEPIQGVMIIAGIFILLDTISGIWKARKIGEAITSNKGKRIFYKLLIYQGTIMTCFLLERFILTDIISTFITITPYLITKIIALLVVSNEIISLNENIEKATGQDLFDRARTVLKVAKGIKNEIDDFKEDKKEEINS